MSDASVVATEFRFATGRWRRRVPLTTALALGFAAVVALFALFGPWLAPHDPYAQNLQLGVSDPSAAHWLGTDELGRDVLSRTIVGARTAVIGPLLIALGSTLLGNALGVLAGYKGGWLDSLILRWVDLMYALPSLLVAIVVVGVLGGGYFLAVGLLVLLSTPYVTRIARGATLEQRPRPYVEAARTLGLSDRQIMLRHVWPNVVPFAVATACLNFAFSLVTLSGLSFLGLGVDPSTADWGRMLAEARMLIFDNPVAALAPGGMIVLTAAAVNLIGDWVYERLSDRGSRR